LTPGGRPLAPNMRFQLCGIIESARSEFYRAVVSSIASNARLARPASPATCRLRWRWRARPSGHVLGIWVLPHLETKPFSMFGGAHPSAILGSPADDPSALETMSSLPELDGALVVASGDDRFARHVELGVGNVLIYSAMTLASRKLLAGDFALPLPRRFRGDFGERRQQVVDDSPVVGLDLDGDGHAGGEGDDCVVDGHGGFVEGDGDGEHEGLLLAGGGRGSLGRVGGGGCVRERPLGLFLRDRGRGDLDDLAVQHAETGKGKGVDLDHGRLAELDEADVEIGDERLDLEPAAVWRDRGELLAGGDDLADRGHRRLLHDAVDRCREAGVRFARGGFGERLARFVRLARGVGELVLIVGEGLSGIS